MILAGALCCCLVGCGCGWLGEGRLHIWVGELLLLCGRWVEVEDWRQWMQGSHRLRPRAGGWMWEAVCCATDSKVYQLLECILARPCYLVWLR